MNRYQFRIRDWQGHPVGKFECECNGDEDANVVAMRSLQPGQTISIYRYQFVSEVARQLPAKNNL